MVTIMKESLYKYHSKNDPSKQNKIIQNKSKIENLELKKAKNINKKFQKILF